MGVCSSKKEFQELQKLIKEKERRFQQIDIEIEKLGEKHDELLEQGLTQQADLINKKKKKLYKEQSRLKNFIENNQTNQSKIQKAEQKRDDAIDKQITSKQVYKAKITEKNKKMKHKQYKEKMKKLDNQIEDLQESLRSLSEEEEEEDPDFEQNYLKNEERLRKKREQKKQKIIEKENEKETENQIVSTLQYPDIQKEKFIPVKKIQDQNIYQSIQQQYQSQGAVK